MKLRKLFEQPLAVIFFTCFGSAICLPTPVLTQENDEPACLAAIDLVQDNVDWSSDVAPCDAAAMSLLIRGGYGIELSTELEGTFRPRYDYLAPVTEYLNPRSEWSFEAATYLSLSTLSLLDSEGGNFRRAAYSNFFIYDISSKVGGDKILFPKHLVAAVERNEELMPIRGLVALTCFARLDFPDIAPEEVLKSELFVRCLKG
ncbi:hypothetical protein AB3Y40_20350 [Yoonia sp. R2331]|uniref:hypothetical protein n=1 Tax=Yoonia sp. R2331 TaxID=3237238 RepID=UPI0034E5A58F